MERSRAILLALMGVSGVWFSRISGAEEVEMRVRPGDDVTLYSDCVWKSGFKTAWFKKTSDEGPPAVLTEDTLQMFNPRYVFVWNSSSNAHDLLVKNVCESDRGLYYCSKQRKISKGRDKSHVYDRGNRTIQLSLHDQTPPFADLPKTTSTPPVSDCSICWKLLVSACPVCFLLVSICVYCVYRYRTKAADGGAERRGNVERTGKRSEDGGEGEVCYASLDLPSRGQKHLEKKKRRVEGSDFSTYSEIKFDRV